MYFWTPHWAQAKYDLTAIKLPAVTSGVQRTRPRTTPPKYACAYPQDDLYKAFNDQLQTKAPSRTTHSCRRCPLHDDDQNGIALDINNGDGPAGRCGAEVARRQPDGVAAVGRRRPGRTVVVLRLDDPVMRAASGPPSSV